MKKLNPFLILISFVLLLFVSSGVNGQDKPGDNFAPQQNEQFVRQNFLRELGLDREQIQQIRMLNMNRAPLMQEAQKRLREANRNLDQAIYADLIDEKAIQLRLQEVQAAQSEVFKLRAMNEFEVRKILTPEQLTKFRELREKFANRINNNNQQQRLQNNRQDAPARQMPKNNSDQRTIRPDTRQRP